MTLASDIFGILSWNRLASADPKAVDLLEKLLVLNPLKRLTAEQALQHPYVVAFHKPEREPALDHDVVPTLSDAVQLSVEEYRNKLYEVITQQKRHQFRRLSLKYNRTEVVGVGRQSPEGANSASSTPPSTANVSKSKVAALVKSAADSKSLATSSDSISAGSGSGSGSRSDGSSCKRSTSIQELAQRFGETNTAPSNTSSSVLRAGRKLITRHSDNWSGTQIRSKEVSTPANRVVVDGALRKSSSSSQPQPADHRSTPTTALHRSHSGQSLVTNNCTNTSHQCSPESKGESSFFSFIRQIVWHIDIGSVVRHIYVIK